MNQRVAVRMLEKLGCRVDVVTDGLQVLRQLPRGAYDLVFMDCQMPELDGYEIAAAIRRQEAGTGRRTPIVTMTASAMAGDRDRCLEAGMDDYLSKPTRAVDLQAALDRCGGRRSGESAP